MLNLPQLSGFSSNISRDRSKNASALEGKIPKEGIKGKNQKKESIKGRNEKKESKEVIKGSDQRK
jgi:hypothetical protein